MHYGVKALTGLRCGKFTVGPLFNAPASQM